MDCRGQIADEVDGITYQPGGQSARTVARETDDGKAAARLCTNYTRLVMQLGLEVDVWMRFGIESELSIRVRHCVSA